MRSQAVRARPPVVLIVGDDDEARAMYAVALHFMGVHPLVAATADEAFTRACEHHPDVVVTDLSLGTSSLDLLRRLHEDTRTRAATLMALTAQTGTAVARQAHAIGCHRFVLKPCPPDALAGEILNALSPDPEGRRAQDDSPRTTGRPAWTDTGHRTTF